MATSKTTKPKTAPKAKSPPKGKPLSSLAPPPPAEPETIIDSVRRQAAPILAAYIAGHRLDEIGGSLEPQLTGFQIRAALVGDTELAKLWAAAKEERAHELVDSAGSWAMIMAGKDGVESKLKVAAVIAPKLYGAKSTLELTGKDGGPIAATVALEPGEAYRRMLGG